MVVHIGKEVPHRFAHSVHFRELGLDWKWKSAVVDIVRLIISQRPTQAPIPYASIILCGIRFVFINFWNVRLSNIKQSKTELNYESDENVAQHLFT